MAPFSLLWSSKFGTSRTSQEDDSGPGTLASTAHWLEVDAIVQQLGSTRPDGLTEDEVLSRLEE